MRPPSTTCGGGSDGHRNARTNGAPCRCFPLLSLFNALHMWGLVHGGSRILDRSAPEGLPPCLHPFLFPAIPNLDLQSFTLQLHTLDPWLGAARVSSGSSAKDPAANLELDSKFIHDPRHPRIHHAANSGTGPVVCWPAPIAGTARPSRLWKRSRAGHAVAVCVTRRVWGGVRRLRWAFASMRFRRKFRKFQYPKYPLL